MRKQRRISFAVTAKLIRVLVFATGIVQSSTSYIQNFKPLAILCGFTAWFVSDLVGNPEDQFSHNEANLISFIITEHSLNFNAIHFEYQ